jgi:hypothetical protein
MRFMCRKAKIYTIPKPMFISASEVLLLYLRRKTNFDSGISVPGAELKIGLYHPI